MIKNVRVNIRSVVNQSMIRRERRDGRDYIIVPSATLPDDIIMNGSAGRVRYPAAAIAKSFGGLENTPAPLGHPSIEGRFVSAKDPEGLARGWIGAWNSNVRRENGRVLVDKVIDVATASQLEGGKAVLNAIEKGEPIHTSVGLFCCLNELGEGDDAEWEASDIAFDHDAILLGEQGAATPDQGVGMMVNSAAGENGETIEVINSSLDDDIERDLDWAIDSALRAIERAQRLPLLERVKSAIKQALHGDKSPEGSTYEDNTVMNEEQFKDLSGKVQALAEGLGGIGAQIDASVANAVAIAVKPITDQLTANAEAAKAEAEAKKADAVAKVVNAGLLTDEVAKEADIAVLNALVEKHTEASKPGHAMRVVNGFNGGDKKPGFSLPKGD